METKQMSISKDSDLNSKSEWQVPVLELISIHSDTNASLSGTHNDGVHTTGGVTLS